MAICWFAVQVLNHGGIGHFFFQKAAHHSPWQETPRDYGMPLTRSGKQSFDGTFISPVSTRRNKAPPVEVENDPVTPTHPSKAAVADEADEGEVMATPVITPLHGARSSNRQRRNSGESRKKPVLQRGDPIAQMYPNDPAFTEIRATPTEDVDTDEELETPKSRKKGLPARATLPAQLNGKSGSDDEDEDITVPRTELKKQTSRLYYPKEEVEPLNFNDDDAYTRESSPSREQFHPVFMTAMKPSARRQGRDEEQQHTPISRRRFTLLHTPQDLTPGSITPLQRGANGAATPYERIQYNNVVLYSPLVPATPNDGSVMKKKEEYASMKRIQDTEFSTVLYTAPSDEGTPANIKQKYTTMNVKHGRYGTVMILQQNTEKKGPKALKRQQILSPGNPDDPAYREWRIFQRLALLSFHKKCHNFVLMLEWYKEEREEGVFMDFLMECANSTLHDKKSFSLKEFQEITFQLCWALHVAEAEAEFVHRDFHAKNVMLQYSAAPYSYTDGISTWYTSGIVVKIIDFGLSRIKLLNGEVVSSKRDPMASLYTPATDIEALKSLLNGMKINEFKMENLKTSDLLRTKVKQLREIKKYLSDICQHKHRSLLDVIRHPFFFELSKKPSSSIPPISVSLRGTSAEVAELVKGLSTISIHEGNGPIPFAGLDDDE